MGSGGIGGVVSSVLNESAGPGVEVVTLTTNPGIAAAIEAQGFRLREGGSTRAIRGRVVTALQSGEAPFDWILLATQPPQVEAAARGALPWLGPKGAMVCFQNGLCEARIAKLAGAERVVGAVVAWGASMPETGLFERTSDGGFTLGRIEGIDDPRLPQLATLLEPIGPVTLTRNLAGARWSKLAINCAISTLGTLGGMRLGGLMVHRFVRRLALEIMTEVVEVARAQQIHLEKVSGTIDLDWIALTAAERRVWGSPGLVAKHSMLLAVGARYRNLRSSMLAAIERGRTPAVDFLNGEVVDHGKRLGIATPVNAEAQVLVHALAKGIRKPSLKLVHRLAAYARLKTGSGQDRKTARSA
ncbi:MAG: 2-dehydropantoate 2-reductase [Myxococcaceae bacterium]|nr:2-dehydropantoate 2-reductase [Myxococcaceae bacterium]